MPRRKRHSEEQENHERWLLSYADFITLLFAFFVVMYAISSVSEGKYRVVSNSLVAAFRNVDSNASGQLINAAMIAPDLTQPVLIRRNPKSEERRRQTQEKIRRMSRDILTALDPLVRDGQVRLTEGAQGIAVEINASVLFAPGEAKLDASAIGALRAVAQVVAGSDFPVIVEGHTDNVPISTAYFPTNWELSVMRASTVVRLFADAGVAPQRLTASGFGQQRPLTSNETSEGRARNRRVTILIEAPSAAQPLEGTMAAAALR